MYHNEHPFPYAKDYYMILPKEFAKKHERGGWEVIEQDGYSICFRPNTPKNIKERFVREYAEYRLKMEEQGIWL